MKVVFDEIGFLMKLVFDESGFDEIVLYRSGYDSCGNGLADSRVKAVKDKVRTLILATNAAYILKLDGTQHVVYVDLMDGGLLRGARNERCSVACLHALTSCSIVCQRRRSRQESRGAVAGGHLRRGS